MDDYEIELIDYLRVLWRRKWIILVTFVAAVLAAYFASTMLPSTYQVRTSLLLLPPLASELNAAAIGTTLAAKTYQELAVSTTVLESVLDSGKISSGMNVWDLRKHLSVSATQLSASAQSNGVGTAGSQILLKATFSGSDPELLVRLAKEWTAAFSTKFGDLFQDRTTRSYDYIRENYAETEADLEALIAQRGDFLGEHPIDTWRAERDALRSHYSATTIAVLKAGQEMEKAQAFLAAHEEGTIRELPTYVLTSGVNLETLSGALAFGLSAGEFAEMTKARIASLKQSAAALAAELSSKEQEITSAEAALSELDRQISLLKSSLAELSGKLLNARIAKAETPDPIRVIDEPLAPKAPISPNKKMNIAVAGILSLMVGVLLAFFYDYIARMQTDGKGPRRGVGKAEQDSTSEAQGGHPSVHSDDNGKSQQVG